MDVIIDGQRGYDFSEDPGDMLTAFAVLDDALREQGRGILSVKIDGRSYAPEEIIDAFEDKPVDEVEALEIMTEDLLTLVDNCLSDMEQVLADLPVACHRLAELFQSENPEEGYEPFEQLAQIWHQIKLREQQVLSALGAQPDSLQVRGRSLTEFQAEFNEYLQEAVDALQEGDIVTLADLLEYELAPRAEQESDVVAALRQCAGERAQSS